MIRLATPGEESGEIWELGVDGWALAAIMPRSLRVRCPSADSQSERNRQVRAVQIYLEACIIVGLPREKAKVLFRLRGPLFNKQEQIICVGVRVGFC